MFSLPQLLQLGGQSLTHMVSQMGSQVTSNSTSDVVREVAQTIADAGGGHSASFIENRIVPAVESAVGPAVLISQFNHYVEGLKEDMKRDDPGSFGMLSVSDARQSLPVANTFFMPRADYLTLLATQESYKNPASRAPVIGKRTMYQPTLSSDRIAVYTRGSGFLVNVFIGIHGTKPSLEDAKQDLGLISGATVDSNITITYMTEILRIIQGFLRMSVELDEIFIGGHSLGGYYALLASFLFKTNGRGFNAALNPLSQGTERLQTFMIAGRQYSTNGMYSYSNFYSYVMEGDLIAQPGISALPKEHVRVLNVNDRLTAIQKHSLELMVKYARPNIPL